MLNKNIYLIYPPGYSGSYLSWCIYKSEIDSAKTTVDSPLNHTKSEKYGGVGTAHLHHRVPTHMGIRQLLYWLVLNQPKDKRVYLVNSWSDAKLGDTLNYIMHIDRDPVIIHITADDEDTRALGNINAITKWPVYFKIHNFNDTYNFTDNANDIQSRNSFVCNYENIFPNSHTMNFNRDEIDEKSYWYHDASNIYSRWYSIRNEHNPHEVNETMYVPPADKPKHYYPIDLMEVYKDSLPLKIAKILKDVDAGTFDFTYVQNYHQTYVNAQPHVKYVDEIKKFRETKVLTEYLDSHALIQALVIRDIKKSLPNEYDWETKTLQEIVKAIQS